MRLFDLAYCCRLYAEATEFDASLAQLRTATSDSVDLSRADHRQLTLEWLRRWGCRTLRVEDTNITLDVIARWADRWVGRLPPADRALDALTETDLDAVASAYGELASAPAARRRHGGGLVDVTFGPTAAAKTLFAIRPEALLPWDKAIRDALGYDGGPASYREAIIRARRELVEAAREAGVPTERLPELVNRPLSRPPKLVDEHDWVRHAMGHDPPDKMRVQDWLRMLGNEGGG